MHYSKIANKIRPEVGEDEEHEKTQQTNNNTGRGDRSMTAPAAENSSFTKTSPRKKSARKHTRVVVDESSVAQIDGDDEIIAAGRFDRPHIIY